MSLTVSAIESLKQEFMIASTDEKRIEFARKFILILSNNTSNNFNSKEKLTLISNNLCHQIDDVKSELYATKLYEEGDCYFKECLFDKAIISFTHSLSLAPLNLVGLIFAKRSAALESMGKLFECLADIESADQYGYPDTLHTALKLLQEMCSKNLSHSKIETSKNFKQQNNALMEIKEKIDGINENITNLINVDCKEYKAFPKLALNYVKNKNIPCLSEAIDVAYNNIFGKHVIATRDIEPGEVLIVEEAYAAVLNQRCWWTHCTHCLQRSFKLQPCKNCCWAMFCSSQCQQEAGKYHNMECEIVTEYLKINGDVDTSELLTIRIIAAIGFDNLLEMLCRKDDINDQCNNPMFSIFDLISHDLYRSFDDMLEACCIAIDIVNCSKFAYELCLLNQLAGLMLRIFLCRDSNAHGLIEYIDEDSKNLKMRKVGSGIFIISSLVNHSCDPNVFRVNYRNTLVHRASRYIEKGTQVMISYGVQFDKTCKVEREKYLEKYYFDCSCMACVNCWPLKEYLPKLPLFTSQEKDAEKMFLKLISDKQTILAKETSKVDQDMLFSVNKKLLELLYQNKKCLNQIYVEAEYEFKWFYRMLCTVKN